MKMMRARHYFVLCMTALVIAVCMTGCEAVKEPELSAVVVSYYATESTVYSSETEVVKEVADSVVEISTESVTTNFGRQYIVSGAGAA